MFKNWSVKDGDYQRRESNYNSSYEKLLKDKKTGELLFNLIWGIIGFLIINLVLFTISSQ